MIAGTAVFTCSICGEPSTDICVYCTKDACANHRCDRCKRCSDCCECDVPLSAAEVSCRPPVEPAGLPIIQLNRKRPCVCAGARAGLNPSLEPRSAIPGRRNMENEPRMPPLPLLAAYAACRHAFSRRPRILVHGHRGARAVLPENTIPAFEYAIQVGADCLEMDVAVTKDNVLVISHDPHINPKSARPASWRRHS